MNSRFCGLYLFSKDDVGMVVHIEETTGDEAGQEWSQAAYLLGNTGWDCGILYSPENVVIWSGYKNDGVVLSARSAQLLPQVAAARG